MKSQQYDVAIEFESIKSCNDFLKKLSQRAMSGDGYRIATQGDSFKSENEIVSLAIVFFENGGLEAIGEIAATIATWYEYKTEKVKVKNKESEKITELTSDESKDEIESKLKKDIFDKK